MKAWLARGVAAFAALAVVVLIAAKMGAQAQSPAPGPRAIFEMTSSAPSDWDALLGNVENLRAALEHPKVTVVAHGAGLKRLVDPQDPRRLDKMRELARAGVVFAACENTMAKEGVDKTMLPAFVTTVDSGVAEVVRKQHAGWAYVRFDSGGKSSGGDE